MITQQELKEILDYDPETGIFRWKRKRPGIPKDRVFAGCSGTRGYIRIMLNGRRYGAHHLAWLYMYGKLTDKYLDHKNGITSDNRISNLREATASQNATNRKVCRNGLKGAYWYKKRKEWSSAISKDGNRLHLGWFKTEMAAHAAYIEAASKLHGEFAKF